MAVEEGGVLRVLPEIFFSAASRDVLAEAPATLAEVPEFFAQRRQVEESEDIRSGFLEDSTKALWPQAVTSQPEVKSGFLDDPKKLHWQPPTRHEIFEQQVESAAAWTLSEPDSEPDVSPPAPEPSLKLEQLWQSTVEALECRATWGPARSAGPAPRQAYLALFGISSDLFQVDEVRWVVRYRPGHSLTPLDQQMLREWAMSCSRCLRLKALAEKLLKNSSLTSQALGGVLKELLQAFYHHVSQQLKSSPRSFIQLHVATAAWLRRLQPCFVLCHVEDIDQELASKMGVSPPLPKLPQGIELLEHIFHSCRVHEISNCHFQACHHELPAHLVPSDMIMQWIFQRAMQPFLDCLLTWTMDGGAQHPSAIPKEFEGGKKKIRFPGFLSSVETDIQEMANKLSILGLEIPTISAKVEAAGQPVESLHPRSFFERQELQPTSFLGGNQAAEDVAESTGSNYLAILFAVPSAAQPLAAPLPPVAPVAPAPSAPATFFELPKPMVEAEVTKVEEEVVEVEQAKRQQQELRMALDAQVVEKRALKEAEKKLDREEEAQERALLGEPEDEMLLGQLRQEILDEHHMQQRLIDEESVLLRWKLERLNLAEKLRGLYALEAEAFAMELQGFETPQMAMAAGTPRRINVEEILQPSWGPVVNPFDAVEQRSPRSSRPMDAKGSEDPPDLPVHTDQHDPPVDGGVFITAEHLKDPHKELVRHVLYQVYSSCALHLAKAAEAESGAVEVASAVATSMPRPVLGLPQGYSSQISQDVKLVKGFGSRPIDAALEACLLRPLRQQSQWVDMQVVQKVLDLQLLRRIEMLRRYMLMGESRLLEPFLTEAMSTYAVVSRAEVSEVRRAEVAMNMLFQSMVPRPTEPSDDNFLASVTLHLASAPIPIGHGPVRLLDGIRFTLKLDFPMKLFFPERIMLQYSRLFRMIALVNHTLECLKGSWWFLASTSYGMTKSGEEMRSLAALRQGLHHFASTLHRYLLVAVVAAEFQKLEKKVRSAESLEDILIAHRTCLGHCLAKSFLDTAQLEGAQDALAAVVGILDQALQLQNLLEEVASTAPRSFPAWAYSRVHTIHGVFLDLRRSLQLCRPGGDGVDIDVFDEDFFEAWLLQWSRHCDQK